jgi:hypothetical protein
LGKICYYNGVKREGNNFGVGAEVAELDTFIGKWSPTLCYKSFSKNFENPLDKPPKL